MDHPASSWLLNKADVDSLVAVMNSPNWTVPNSRIAGVPLHWPHQWRKDSKDFVVKGNQLYLENKQIVPRDHWHDFLETLCKEDLLRRKGNAEAMVKHVCAVFFTGKTRNAIPVSFVKEKIASFLQSLKFHDVQHCMPTTVDEEISFFGTQDEAIQALTYICWCEQTELTKTARYVLLDSGHGKDRYVFQNYCFALPYIHISRHSFVEITSKLRIISVQIGMQSMQFQ